MTSECFVLEFTATQPPLSYSLGPQNRPHSSELSATINISQALQCPEHNRQTVQRAVTQFLDPNLHAYFIQSIVTSLQYCFKLKKTRAP